MVAQKSFETVKRRRGLCSFRVLPGVFLAMLLPSLAMGATITVGYPKETGCDGACDYGTIQAAIDAASIEATRFWYTGRRMPRRIMRTMKIS